MSVADLHIVHLSDEELILLDGRCSEDAQKEVDRARTRLAMQAVSTLPAHLAAFVADVVSEARAEGRLIYQRAHIRRCFLCGTQPDPPYVLYKSGPRRGEPNLNKPRFFPGIELAVRFVVVRNHITLGGCEECVAAALPEIRRVLADIPAQVAEPLATEGRPAWVRYDRRRCLSCGWEGHEGQMRLLPALLGGSYRGGCPACENESKLFGAKAFEYLSGFDVVSVQQEATL